ncbi:MAG: endonuclease III [Candidatus Micrarchaeia archaeon]
MHDKREFLINVIRRLKERYKVKKTRLRFFTPWQLLVATMLSAQATDDSVNRATSKLFKDYSTIEEFSKLTPSKLYKYIKSIGLYRSKARHIIGAARILSKDYNSKIPESMDELLKLPGIGRKTANILLSNAFGINEGIAIDTHCITVANRLKLVNTRDPAKIEKKLMELLPRSEWGEVNNLFIALGRDTCTARKKHCERCVLNDICPSSSEVKV